MGMWSKLALVTAGALVGGVATRVAGDPRARQAVAGQLQRRSGTQVQRRSGTGTAVERLQAAGGLLREFTARVKSGMDEREAQLREQFGVRTPVDHTANHPGTDTEHTVVGVQDNVESTEVLNRGRTSEGNNR